MNLNIGLFGFLTFVAYMLIFGFTARSIIAKYPDATLSKAIAYIY